MDVLLIDSDPLRRVSVAQHLADARHRVTISSSIAETREILQFVEDRSDAPDIVVIEAALLATDTSDFRGETGARFPGTPWVPLRPDLSPRWLTDWMEKMAALKTVKVAKPSQRRKRVLRVETDSAARAVIWARFRSQRQQGRA
jgi:hypothetical protein